MCRTRPTTVPVPGPVTVLTVGTQTHGLHAQSGNRVDDVAGGIAARTGPDLDVQSMHADRRTQRQEWVRAESGERLTVFAPPMEAAHGEGSLGLPRLSVPGAARTGQVLSRWTTQSPGTEILAIPYVYVVQSPRNRPWVARPSRRRRRRRGPRSEHSPDDHQRGRRRSDPLRIHRASPSHRRGSSDTSQSARYDHERDEMVQIARTLQRWGGLVRPRKTHPAQDSSPKLSPWPKAISRPLGAASADAGERSDSSNSWPTGRHEMWQRHERPPLTSKSSKSRATPSSVIEKLTSQLRTLRGRKPRHRMTGGRRPVSAVFTCDPCRSTSRSASEHLELGTEQQAAKPAHPLCDATTLTIDV